MSVDFMTRSCHRGTDVSTSYFRDYPICHACATLRTVANVQTLLRYANRRLLARELTARGYPVSGETLNRWVRLEQEIPVAAERTIREVFGVAEHKEEAPPHWAVRLLSRVDDIYARQGIVGTEMSNRVIEALTDPERLDWMRRIADAVAEWPTQSGAASDGPPDTEDRDVGAPGGRELA